MDFYDYEAIGKELKRLRKENACTQEQMAEQLGCTAAFVSNVENSRARLSLRVLTYYARLFHVSVDSILNAGQKNTDAQDASAVRDAQAIEILHQFSPSDQEQIIKVLRYIASIRKNQDN